MRLRIVLPLLFVASCVSARDNTIRSMNIAAVAESAAGAELYDHCTVGYRLATTKQDLEGLDRVCGPARKAYAVLRQARLAALAAYLTAEASGDDAAMRAAASKLADATIALQRAVAHLPEAP